VSNVKDTPEGLIEDAILEGRLLLKGLDPDDPIRESLMYMLEMCEEAMGVLKKNN